MIDCYQKGIMTSCSMMVNMPAAAEAAKLMVDNPGLSVGIHLNLTVGKPLTSGLKTLVKEDGTFNKGNLRESSHVDKKEIEIELHAQMKRFIELTGHLPTHLDSHHGIEQIQGAEAVVCALSREYDLPVRRFFTLPKGNHKDMDYEVPLMKFGKVVDSQYSDPRDLTELFTQAELDSDNVAEFALHPGYVDYEIMQISSLNIGRLYDAHVFLSDDVKAWLKSHPEVTLTEYSTCRKIR